MDRRSNTGLMLQSAFANMFGAEDISTEKSDYGLNIADYMFNNRSVVAEQKDIIDVDKHEEIEPYPDLEKLHEQYGLDEKGSINFSAWPEEELFKFKRFFQDKTTFAQHVISKADKQIRDTKLKYNIKNARGLLIIVNTCSKVHYFDLHYRMHDLIYSKNKDSTIRYKHVNSILCLNENSSRPETMTTILERFSSADEMPNGFEYSLVDYIERNRVNRRGFQSGPMPANRPWGDVQKPIISL